LCLFGHTHYPVTFELSEDDVRQRRLRAGAANADSDESGCKYLINPGSVGQPRDGDPRAAYALVDTKLRRIELYRVKYPVEEAQAKVMKAGCRMCSRSGCVAVGQ
jgi:diadenosine tetraphosphatase ApaH/serine/threonine PP2A family protein phosphatase